MFTKSFIALILLIVAAQSNYMITIKCGYYSCPFGCNQCQVLDGGPFNQYTTCVDGAGGCSAGNTFNMSFACGGCSTSSSDCSYTVQQSGYYPYTGCTNYIDTKWYVFKSTLDNMYKKSNYSISSYDWCSNACTGLATVWIIVIVVGAVAILAIAGCIKRRRDQRLKAQIPIFGNDVYNQIRN